MTWEPGAATIRDLIARGHLERVPPSSDHAESMIATAQRHLASASAVAATDPDGAYSMLYDAARKALAAILTNQGLRVTAKGGHVAGYEAVRAQLDPPLGRLLRPFQRLRIRRNEIEYASAAAPEVTIDEVEADLPKAHDLIEVARKSLPEMGPF